MCRLVAGYAWSRDGSSTLGALVELAARAAERDPYLYKAYGQNTHCHGYGFVLLYRVERDAWRILYERYDAYNLSLSEEEACRKNIEAVKGVAERLKAILAASDEAFIIFHVRHASEESPRGSMNAHPFFVKSRLWSGALEIYLAHNGSIDKTGLAHELRLSPDDYTDSHLLALSIARRLEAGEEDIVRILVENYKYTITAYNIAILVLEDKGGTVFPSMYLAAGYSENLDKAKKEYYKYYIFTQPTAAGMTSSTIRDLAVNNGVPVEFSQAGKAVYSITVSEGLVKQAYLTETK